MKNPLTFPLILVLAMVFTMCTPQRYTEDGPEIEIAKQLSNSLSDPDNEGIYEAYYADTAKIYWNSVTPLTWRQAMLGVQISLEPFTDMKYLDGQAYEKVVTDKGETWVGFWGVWQGRIKETDIIVQVPVHFSSRFEAGKIVEESGFWDNQILTNALRKAGHYGDESK